MPCSEKQVKDARTLRLGYHVIDMVTKELYFAVDEKGYKALAPTLVGQKMSYWDRDNQLHHGKVTAAEVARGVYGKPFIEVTIEEEAAPEPASPAPSS